MKDVVIIDYYMGNLHSVSKAVEAVAKPSDFSIKVSSEIEEVLKADGIILPGVGAFGRGMQNLRRLGLTEVLREKAYSGTPFLGICLGLQLLFTRSREHGEHEGLDIIKGEVVHFPQGLKVPHMGWNQIQVKVGDEIFEEIPQGSFFYFVHSYFVKPEDEKVILATTDYGINFASVVRKDKIYGVQFHPEKSQKLGLKLLRNFLQVVRRC